jgi:hypothetical protein
MPQRVHCYPKVRRQRRVSQVDRTSRHLSGGFSPLAWGEQAEHTSRPERAGRPEEKWRRHCRVSTMTVRTPSRS